MTAAYFKPCYGRYSTSAYPLFLAAAILIVGSLARPAGADEFDAVNVVLGGTVTNDSNLFKRPTPVSDTISTGYVGLRIDKPYAQQRFQLDVTETTTRYDSNPRLNFDALDYRGAWLWQLGPRLSGMLSADRKETLAPFEDTLDTQRNVRISENRAFNLDGWVAGGWHVLAGISQANQTSDLATETQPDFRSVSSEAGVKYLAPSGNSITAVRRSIRGEYQNLTIVPAITTLNEYREDQSELSASWRLSGNSNMSGRLAWLERDNSDVTLHDFAGPSADILYTWTPTGRLTVNVSARRATGALQDTSFSYTSTDTLSFAPTWKVSDKTVVSLRLERENLKYRGTGSVPAVGPARRDTTDSAALNVDWSPARGLSFGASVQHQSRTSNTPGFEYDATITSIRAELTF